MEIDDETLMEHVTRELMDARGASFQVKLNPWQAVTLLAQLQLALRHPNNKGGAADWARELAKRLESHVAQAGPHAAELCRRGWDPKFDAEE